MRVVLIDCWENGRRVRQKKGTDQVGKCRRIRCAKSGAGHLFTPLRPNT